jgi:6-phosphofructokinase 1
MLSADDFRIPTLGPCGVNSPLESAMLLREENGILVEATLEACRTCAGAPPAMESAGPRRSIFFNPKNVRAAIVTCGGLCPGLNDVIRGVTMVLWYRYGVEHVVGLRYGYEGLIPQFGQAPLALTPEVVADIHKNGGTILGSSRGPQKVSDMVDFLAASRINMLFTVGGDGTQRGALEICREMERRGLVISVVGIPKTIDNDISWTERTFGFETAVAMSQAPIDAAHMEAKGVRNGVGLVRLMGRESGFVAAYAALASSDVNLVLIPEAPFSIAKLMAFLEGRLARKSHAVIVVAEGAGQDLLPPVGANVSGNVEFGDIGLFLKKAISGYFCGRGSSANVKYIDPSYTIRSAAANADDSVFCFQLAENAVHAAMSGRTAMVVALWNGHFVHVPIEIAVASRKRVDPAGPLWQSVLDNTGQPMNML